MTTMEPGKMDNQSTDPDPKRPYKAYAAAVAAAGTEILNSKLFELGQPWESILTIIVAGCAAFVIPNPRRRRETPRNPRRDQAGPPRVV